MNTHTLDIIDTAYEGYGVGRISGKTVFVPFTVQGDNVTVNVIEEKKKYSFGNLLKINRYSQHRGEKYCPYIGQCGGCLFGHIKHASQVKIKEQIVKNALRKCEDFKIDSIISKEPLNYRFRINLKVKNGETGFLRHKSHEIIPLEECPVMKPSLMNKVNALKGYTDKDEQGSIYIIENEENKALLKTDCNFSDSNRNNLLNIFDGFSTQSGVKGAESIPVKTVFGSFYTGFNGFSQSNRFLLSDFQKTVADMIPDESRLLELYAGSGFLTLAAAEKAKEIKAYEISGESVSLAKKAKISNAYFQKEDVDRNIFRISDPFDTILVNPGRKGMGKKVTEFIKQNKPENLIYVSCNPMTMSRDIHRIGEHYNIDKFFILDMFPGTYHIECIAKLNKK
ncbi:MAG: class I SAM-dependent RNA methyltransferase [Flexistipes sinusarabici]|uniref:Class I SAM-dependent RNA methyltransferase n=1 Tax=Flexistipes sinusarabici TaxID=2352 RepID=A0A5D0MYT1_FLESI|nr:TRAM domain-containing protein [Flexistipes sinusarabici]TYB37319.1 MAG: class I SAM-dependent RNA methyltransferase [Flexistipes sinusarabici]